MSITVNSLISDSFNFLKNQIINILILSFISATITLILYYFLIPIDEIGMIIKNISSQNESISLLTFVSKLSNEEKVIIIKVSLLSLTIVFIGLTFLISSIITYLSEISSGNIINVLQSFILSLRILPNIIILLIICTIIIYLGFILFVLPGVILVIGFSLSPIILITNKNIISPLQAINQSWNIAFNYWWLILSILLLWLILQILLTMLLGHFSFLFGILNNIITFTLNNVLTSFVFIYLFRLYMLSKK
ncbi:MAG: YciC family protein [Arsenophonus endosymbiont of Ceratovacuna japonica]